MGKPWSARAVLVVLALTASAGCRTARPTAPRVPDDQIAALMERSRRAEEAFAAAQAAGTVEEKKRLYVQTLEIEPSHGRALNNLGLLYLEEEDYPQAVAYLREAVKQLPGSAEPRFNLGYAYEAAGRPGTAQEHYEAAVRLSPEEPDYLESLARVYLKRRDNLGEARDLLEKALSVETRPLHVQWIQEQIQVLDVGLLP